MPLGETVLLDVEGPRATVTVNRPEKRNAMDVDVREGLAAAFDRVEDEDGVRVVVLRGAGEGSFIAGGDIARFSEMDMVDSLEYLRRHAGGLYDRIAACPRPVVAAIDGHALGGGLEIALACDLRIATEDAKLGLPEVNLGIIPAAGGTQRLPAVVGAGLAKELIMTGRILEAGEAAEIGLVNRAVPREEFESTIDEFVERLAGKAPIALRLAKEAIDIASLDREGFAFERAAGTVLFGTADKEEGVRAFLEKRDPEFAGR